jgi:tetratricopeptide (TPR) repeat protein
MSPSRSARIFLSSTFRDFGEERDLLVRRVFPALRARLKDRFVELVDVDLRWGITAEQAERGEVLPICLAEIDRARPYFVGMLGERYGWIPPSDGYALDLLERHSWLHDHRGGKSVTELEILHGVLNDPKMAGRAFFYFRSADYAAAKGGDYVPTLEDDRLRQMDLKDRIRESGFPVVEDYPTPEAFATKLEEDLWTILDEAYPEDQIPDAFERESRRHEAYAIPRRRLYLGGEAYGQALTQSLEGGQRILIEGQSGGGKSALIANWLQSYADSHPDVVVFEHYTAASADAADSVSLVRRLIEHIKRVTGSSEELPADPEKLLESLPLWFANASAWGSKEGRRWVFTIDALNGLSDRRDLRWFPEFLPERVHLVISSLPSEVMEALLAKGDWQRLLVNPLTEDECRHLLKTYLARYNKTLTADLTQKVLSHPLSSNPLFLRTLAEELRVFGVYEQLKERLDHYLESQTVDDLFERVLERVEGDCGQAAVQASLEAIWASRAGLAEQEIQKLCNLAPVEWATIRAALDDVLIESTGRITFAHDYLRIAISDRYLQGNNTLDDETQSDEAKALRRILHARIATWFEEEFLSGAVASKTSAQKTLSSGSEPTEVKPQSTETVSAARAAEEIPHQWQRAQNWERLKAALTNKDIFEAVYGNHSEDELLAYWIKLEELTSSNVEKDHEIAWERWSLDESLVETAELAEDICSFLKNAGRYDNFTEKLARLSVIVTEKAKGLTHRKTGMAINSLAGILVAKGIFHEAEMLYRRGLELLENVLKSNDPDIGIIANNLAVLLYKKCDYDAAEPLFRRALTISEDELGPLHFDVSTHLNNIANLLSEKDDGAEAEKLLRRALSIREIKCGNFAPETGVILSNLASLFFQNEKYVDGLIYMQRATDIMEKNKGPYHEDTLICLSNLISYQKALGVISEIENSYKKLIKIYEERIKTDSASLPTVLNNYAAFLKSQNRNDEAELVYFKTLNIIESAHGSDFPMIAIICDNLGLLYQSKKDFESAEKFHRRALTLSMNTKGTQNSDTAEYMLNLGLSLKGMGQNAEAIVLLEYGLDILKKLE